MSAKDDIREFLIARRANIAPEQAGLTAGGTERRVPGLRREEVAMLAGISTDYYTKLERGSTKLRTASDSVLDAISRALQLSAVEKDYFYDLARGPARARQSEQYALSDSLQRVLDSMAVPALAYNARQDVIGSNALGRAMFSELLEDEQPNLARYIFLDARARTFHTDWPLACSLSAAMLRYQAGRDPLNSDLTTLIGELSTRSHQFRKDWSMQDVHEHRTGQKTYRHPVVGDLNVTYDVLEMPGERGVSITTYNAIPESVTERRFALLANRAAHISAETLPPNNSSEEPEDGN